MRNVKLYFEKIAEMGLLYQSRHAGPRSGGMFFFNKMFRRIDDFQKRAAVSEKQNGKLTKEYYKNELQPLRVYLRLGSLDSMKKEELQRLFKIMQGVHLRLEDNAKIMSFLDEEQKEIVFKAPIHPDTHIRILAAAGSGKTTTLLYRVRYLCQQSYIDPRSILILTFNRHSASDLRSRILDVFEGLPADVKIHTIDAYAKFLYENYYFLISNCNNNNPTSLAVAEYISYAVAILRRVPEIIKNKIKYVFVDEFQDVNDIQFELLQHLVSQGCQLTIIGDDCQNIYEFRGTNNSFIVNFDQIFPTSYTYKLQTNYRSRDLIVELANNIVKYNKSRVEKTMIPSKANTSSGQQKNHVACLDLIYGQHTTALFDQICNDIIEQWTTQKKSIAVLLRTNDLVKSFETYLLRRADDRIPFEASIYDSSAVDFDIHPTTTTKTATAAPPSIDKVLVSTFHRSKGLEWDCVYLIGFGEKHMEYSEDERRVLYVGITRGKERVVFCLTPSHFPLSLLLRECIHECINTVCPRTSQEYLKFTAAAKVLKFGRDTEKWLKVRLFDRCKPIRIVEIIKSLQTEDFQKIRAWFEESMGGLPEAQQQFVPLILQESNIDSSILDAFPELFTVAAPENNKKKILCRFPPEVVAGRYHHDLLQFLNYVFIYLCMQKKKGRFEGFQDPDVDDFLLSAVDEGNYRQVKFCKIVQTSYDRMRAAKASLHDLYNLSLCQKFNQQRYRLLYRDLFSVFRKHYKKSLMNVLENFIDHEFGQQQEDQDIHIDINTPLDLRARYNIYDTLPCMISSSSSTPKLIYFITCSEQTDFQYEWYIYLRLYYDAYSQGDSIIKLFNLYTNVLYTVKFMKKCSSSSSDGGDPDAQTDLLEFVYVHCLNNDNYDEEEDEPIIISEGGASHHVDGNHDNANHGDGNHGDGNHGDGDGNGGDGDNGNDGNSNDDGNDDFVLVFDTETSGLSNDADIIQLAYLVGRPADAKEQSILGEFSKYVSGSVPTLESYKVHRIKLDTVRKNGLDSDKVLSDFFKLASKAKHIIGHNISFDIRMIENTMERYKITPRYLTFFKENKKKLIDTYQLSKKKLSKTYSSLYPMERIDESKLHNAMYDVELTYYCYLKLCSCHK